MNMDLENDERIQALTEAASRVKATNQASIIPISPIRIRHRFESWGPTTSSLLLEQLEELGWTITKKEDDG